MNILRFCINGQEREIDFSKPESPSPFCSVLHYIRHYEKLTGTKEMCGKGDCGACTVILASQTDSKGECNYRALDSCLLPLAELHGNHLLTIEAPADCMDTLPIREAFLKERASQCGFCSPGMVLSIYSHIKNGYPFTPEFIKRTLSGNLCRCTGYTTILQAALSLEKAGVIIKQNEKPLLFPIIENNSLNLRKNDESYIRPVSLTELKELLKDYPHLPLTGGLTGSGMTYRKSVIDVSHVKEMLACEETEDFITLGASCTIKDMSTLLGKHFPYMVPYLEDFASEQIRGKATIGGSLADGSPVGDIMPLCMAHNAVCIIMGPDSIREVFCDRFMLNYRKVDLKPGELILAARFERPAKNVFYAAFKQSRRKNMDISSVCLAATIKLINGKCHSVRLVYGGMAAVTAHALQTEKFLKGKVFSLSNCKKAANCIAADFEPLSDLRGSKQFRMDTAKNMLISLYQKYSEQNE